MTLLHPKQYYRDIAPQGWQWVGAGDIPHTHIFQSGPHGPYKTGYNVIECSEDCLTNGDLEFLAKHGMTCNKDRLKKLSRAITKRKATPWHV